jgi:peroxiredoxin
LQNDTIREFVLLNELYQGFYEKDYPLQLTLDLIDTIGNRTFSTLTRNIATNLSTSITTLQPGYYPPQFTLKSIDGNEYTLESFKGKYCYLGFCSLSNLGCLKEFEYLKYQNSKHNKYLQIITIVPEKEKQEISAFVNINSVSWLILYSKNGESLCRDYKVKAFPLFFLIDKEGKLVLSPSPLPSENFEKVLFSVLRAKGDI